MKKKIAIGMLLIFCFAEIRPLLPIIDYNLNYEYISKVLCIDKDKPTSTCHGKCHLRKELKKAQETDKEDKSIPNVEVERIPMIFYENERTTSIEELNTTQEQLYKYTCSVKNNFVSPATPPPQG